MDMHVINGNYLLIGGTHDGETISNQLSPVLIMPCKMSTHEFWSIHRNPEGNSSYASQEVPTEKYCQKYVIVNSRGSALRVFLEESVELDEQELKRVKRYYGYMEKAKS